MGNGERVRCRGGALTISSLFQLPLLCERLLPVPLVQVSPRLHPERQRLLVPRGTRQRLRGRNQDIVPAHSEPEGTRALMLIAVVQDVRELSCRPFPTFSSPTSKAKAKFPSIPQSSAVPRH